MAKITKKEYSEQRANWNAALIDGRVVRYAGGATLKSFKTKAEAAAEVARCEDSEIVVLPAKFVVWMEPYDYDGGHPFASPTALWWWPRE